MCNQAVEELSKDRSLSFPMSNAELAEAIGAAHNRAGYATEGQRVHMEHLKALLAVQLSRAQTVICDYNKVPHHV